jgi:hypothetical protein
MVVFILQDSYYNQYEDFFDSTENCMIICRYLMSSVADPNPDPPDPHVFGPPGSGSTCKRFKSGSGSCSGSGSGSFYHHAKIVRKTLIPTILLFFMTFLSLKMM